LKPTDTAAPEYFHKVVDCQWACPAHTPVPEYIRLIAQGRYADAYMVNWHSNVFPGILGRTCDRPCEPACRRGRVEENQGEKPEPVAICRLKRVAADYKGDIHSRLPRKAAVRNGKRIACVGAGPASLTVARDLVPLGYHVTLFDSDRLAGGMIRSQIPKFRLPESVIDEEVGYILDLGADFRAGHRIDSMKRLLGQGFDAVFVGSGAPRGRDLEIPGRREAAGNINIGIDWLSSVAFGHVTKIGKRVIVLGGGNTAMDCCRSSRRLGGEDVKVIVRSGFEEMKASPWEKEDAMHEGIPILNYLVPKAFLHDGPRLTGMVFEKVKAVYDERRRRSLVPTGRTRPDLRVRRRPHRGRPGKRLSVDRERHRHRIRPVGNAQDRPGHAPIEPRRGFFRRRRGARAQEHHLGRGPRPRCGDLHRPLLPRRGHPRPPPPTVNLLSQKMGIHEWSYDNQVAPEARFKVPLKELTIALRDIRQEVELGFDPELAWKEAQRCLNCDVQTVFSAKLCIECDACVDICPVDCITFTPNGEEGELRARLNAPGAQFRPGALRVAGASHRADHGQGRGRVPALRPVRGALPDRGVGHAEIPARHDARGPACPGEDQGSGVITCVIAPRGQL
jgi:NADPH-dependent glutamate synthase beta subunit-like oxidoreductase